MRRIATLLLTLALVAVACGDGDAGPIFTQPTTTSTPTSTTTRPADSIRFPPEVVEEYMGGCTPEAGEEACRCTIQEFQKRLTLEEFIALAEADLTSDPVVQEVIDFCARDGGSTTTIVAGTTSTTTVPGDDFTPIDNIDDIIDLSVQDLEYWWAAELPATFDTEYEPLSSFGGYYVSEGDIPSCGGPLKREEFEANAFYCGLNDTVQWDVENLMVPLFQEFGDFTVALVLAHEWGHAVQQRFGFDDITHPTIVSELQADCLAGAWTGRIDREESDLLRLEPGDLEEAMAGFLLIGDQLGTSPGGPDAHGGSFDRLNAFFEGFNQGTEQCATYEDVEPSIVFIPLQPDDDPTEGGDLEYADTAPLLIEALEVFWGIVYPEVTGDAWVPVSNTIPYRPSTGDFPACGGTTLEDEFYVGNAFYCPPDDYVAWDDEGLFPDLYTEIGDFAIGLVLANEWARAAQNRAGVAMDTLDAQLQVDCLTGVFTAAMVPLDNPMPIVLAAGDLEEAIAGFLQLSVIPGEDGENPGAFQRFESFKDGFFEGTAVCEFP